MRHIDEAQENIPFKSPTIISVENLETNLVWEGRDIFEVFIVLTYSCDIYSRLFLRIT